MALNIRDKIFTALTLFVLSSSTFWYFLSRGSDPYRCSTLLRDGFWLDPDHMLNWQPAGCMLHSYKTPEASTCLQNRRVVFIGKETTHQIFQGFAEKLDPDFRLSNLGHQSNAFATLSNVRLQYAWDPSLTGSILNEIRSGFDVPQDRPALVIVEVDHETFQYTNSSSSVVHGGSGISTLLSSFSNDTTLQSCQTEALIFIPALPGLSSRLDSKLDSSKELDAASNRLLETLPITSNIDAALVFSDIMLESSASINDAVLWNKKRNLMTDILLDKICNLRLPKHYPHAATCCNSYPGLSWVQVVGFVLVTVFLPVSMLLAYRGNTINEFRLLHLAPASKYHIPLLIMSGSILLCYFCDRTNIFGKIQKQTSPSQFFFGMLFVIIGSLFTLHTSEKELPFLNRNQTDEWKGWMQIAILIYHYVGVSKTEYIYNYMRVCPTSYLFMTGFGHTCYFLKKGDYSFKRFVATMLRLNLLNVVLAYAMGNDYLLYYFAPLCTWNFFVIFGILWFRHEHNDNKRFLFGKILVGAMINTCINRIPGVLEAIWACLQMIFRMQGDLREWRFRVTLDQYSIFPGMIAAVLFTNFDNSQIPKFKQWSIIKNTACVISLVIMLWYAYFEATQVSKQVYNQKHAYLSWLPCCAFVILRNATPWLRSTHNKFFAWAGRGSLETFLLQFHIWLAADTAGLLVVVPARYRLLNFLITTPMFLFVSSLVTAATPLVIEWMMAVDNPSLPTTSTFIKCSSKVPGDDRSEVNCITQDSGTLEKIDHRQERHESTAQRAFGLIRKDLRMRVVLWLAGMMLMNWTYYVI